MLSEIVAANKNYAVITVNKQDVLDKTAIRVIKNDCPTFVQPIRLVSIDNEIQLRFEIQGGIRLAYISMHMRKSELNKLLYQMLTPFKECADFFLDYHYIYLDRNYIMVNQSDYKITYIYMPNIPNQNTEEKIMKFFADFVMEIDLQDDPAYITKLIRCIMSRDATVLTLLQLVNENSISNENRNSIQIDFEEMPAKENRIPISEHHEMEKQNTTEVKKEVTTEDNKPEKEFGKESISDVIGAGLFGDMENKDKKKKDKKEKETGKKAKGFLGKLLENNKKPNKAETTVQERNSQNVKNSGFPGIDEQLNLSDATDYVMESSVTEINEDEEQNRSTDRLRLKLEKSLVENVPPFIEIDLSKGYAVVGRYDKSGKLSADYNFDMSLTFIGRRHMRFEKSGEEFYLIDLESKNHTYLNNEELLPNRRYTIHSNDRITITQKYAITYKVC